MLIAVTGATGFLGRYIVNRLLAAGHRCRCWHRYRSDLGGFQTPGSHTSQQLGRAAANSVADCARCIRARTDSKRLVIACPPVPWPSGA